MIPSPNLGDIWSFQQLPSPHSRPLELCQDLEDTCCAALCACSVFLITSCNSSRDADCLSSSCLSPSSTTVNLTSEDEESASCRFSCPLSTGELLHTLAKAKLLHAVRSLVHAEYTGRTKRDINETDNGKLDGDSALCIACEGGDTDRLLLHVGAWPQPDSITPLCWVDIETPLFRAILEGHIWEV